MFLSLSAFLQALRPRCPSHRKHMLSVYDYLVKDFVGNICICSTNMILIGMHETRADFAERNGFCPTPRQKYTCTSPLQRGGRECEPGARRL